MNAGIKSRLARLALAVLALAGMLWGQQPPTPASPGTGTEEAAKGRIAGIIVSAKTGEILRGVSLTLRGMRGRGANAGPPVMRETNTGLDGQFAFEELPAADYDLLARKSGYGSENMFRPQMRLRLGADEVRDDVVLRMQPSAVVTGRVLDAYGEPLAEAEVCAIMRRAFPGRGRQLMALQRTSTNDLGEYRLHSLEAGRYVIAARPARTTNPRGVGYAEFAASYYPNASSYEQATPLKLTNGAELAGIDFHLELAPETTVRGIVTRGSTGEPCGECSLQFRRDDVMGFDDSTVRPTEEGIFEVHGVPGGVQSVLIHEFGGRLGGRRRPSTSVEQVQVPEAGEVEVALAIGALQAVSGEFILEGAPEAEGPAADGQAGPGRPPMMFGLEAAGPYPFSGDRGTVPPQGGPFEFPEISPGDYRIRLYGPRGAYLRLVTLGGRELDGPRVTVPADGPLTGLKLYLTFGGASVGGVVKPASGEQISETQGEQVVILAPDNPDSYADQVVVRAQPDGSFEASGLVPGSYTLFSAPSPFVDVEDPDIRRTLKPYSKQITLKKDEQARVELTAVPESVELW